MKAGTAFWMGHVATKERDGIAASKYARIHGLSVTALRYWVPKTARKRDGGGAACESIPDTQCRATRRWTA